MVKPAPAAGIVGLAALREAASGEYRQIMELVQAALVAKLGYTPEKSWMVCIEAIFAERVIVRRDGRFWSYPYKLSAENKVELGEAQEVVENYVPVALREALESSVLIEAAAPDGSAWDAILVRAGRSGNGNYYPDETLRDAARLFEGARVYAKSNEEHLRGSKPDVNKLAGWISGARFVEGARPDTGHVAGRLNIAAGAASLRETIVDAWQRGKRDLVGLSIDALAKTEKRLSESFRRAVKFVKINSVDLVIDPSAGGALVRLAEAADPKENTDVNLRQTLIAAILAKFPGDKDSVEALAEDKLVARYAEALAADKPAPKDKAGEPMTREEFQDAMRLVEARQAARAKIEGCGLPQPAIARLLDWANRQDGEHLAEAEVDKVVKAEREYLARFTEAGKVSLAGLDVQTVEDRAKKVTDMLDAFFDPEHKEHRNVRSFRECYVDITGDARITGRFDAIDRRRLAESLGVMRESLDSSSWANVLGNSITRRMVADYRRPNQYDIWRQIVSVVPVNDFRTNERTRFGGYGDLPTVAQSAPYLALTSPTDEKATYAVSKKGGTEDVTLEMIKNDDVGAIRLIPVKLSRSAKRTLAKFVLDFIRTNPTLYDSVAWFHATHNNLGSTALDATSLAAARLRMLKQAEADSADRLGIGPKYLVVPVDLEEAAVNLFNRNTNNDKTFVNAMSLVILPVWYWTDTNDWALMADPMELPTIEIGFLDGNEEPELFVQDNPTVGSLFTNDKVTYKIRFIFGGQVVNFRGGDKSVVA